MVGLNQVACPTLLTAQRNLQRALLHRHTRSHKLNDYSSRSHCLITFLFASKDNAAEGNEQQQGAQGGMRR